MKYQVEHGKNMVIHADVSEVDDSFDHSFGTQKRNAIEIENIEVQVFDDNGWDLWLLPRDETQAAYFKDEILAKYLSDKAAS
jgi:hypothetical protein